jgi:hypothetical protein
MAALFKKLLVMQIVKKFPAFVELEGSSSRSQRTSIVSYPEPIEIRRWLSSGLLRRVVR